MNFWQNYPHLHIPSLFFSHPTTPSLSLLPSLICHFITTTTPCRPCPPSSWWQPPQGTYFPTSTLICFLSPLPFHKGLYIWITYTLIWTLMADMECLQSKLQSKMVSRMAFKPSSLPSHLSLSCSYFFCVWIFSFCDANSIEPSPYMSNLELV